MIQMNKRRHVTESISVTPTPPTFSFFSHIKWTRCSRNITVFCRSWPILFTGRTQQLFSGGYLSYKTDSMFTTCWIHRSFVLTSVGDELLHPATLGKPASSLQSNCIWIHCVKGQIANKFVVLVNSVAKVKHCSRRTNDSLVLSWVITDGEGTAPSAHCLGCTVSLVLPPESRLHIA